ncbi:MAG: lipid-A-disaccharide synthase [Turneriella sp.]
MAAAPVLLVAGEESGDLLGAAIVREVLKKKKLRLWGCGGQRLRDAGMDVRFTSEELSTIGFFEAAKNYRRLTKIMDQLVQEASANGTREAWLIDFPGFNIMLAKKLKEKGIRCTMIVSPTVWAWKYKRVFKIRERFERVLCLYDFEPDIYNEIGVEAHYIGHPLTAETVNLQAKLARSGNPVKKVPQLREIFRRRMPVIAVMPGSRPAEVHYHTARIIEGIRLFAQKHPGYAFIIPAANAKIHELLSRYKFPENTFLVEYGAPYVLDIASAAIACSGTVTLECALFGVPHLILYRSSWMSYAIFRRVVRIPYIGMVNVLAGKFVVQEFLQHRLTAQNIATELEKILHDEPYRRAQQGELRLIADRLTAFEPAKQAARILLKAP